MKLLFWEDLQWAEIWRGERFLFVLFLWQPTPKQYKEQFESAIRNILHWTILITIKPKKTTHTVGPEVSLLSLPPSGSDGKSPALLLRTSQPWASLLRAPSLAAELRSSLENGFEFFPQTFCKIHNRSQRWGQPDTLTFYQVFPHKSCRSQICLWPELPDNCLAAATD